MIASFRILAVMVILGTSLVSQAQEIKTSEIKNSRFVLKTNKSLKGGSVEVFTADGRQLLQQTILRKRVVVSFAAALPGTYKIKVSGRNTTKEYKIRKAEAVTDRA